jgi:hypothetical protein
MFAAPVLAVGYDSDPESNYYIIKVREQAEPGLTHTRPIREQAVHVSVVRMCARSRGLGEGAG